MGTGESIPKGRLGSRECNTRESIAVAENQGAWCEKIGYRWSEGRKNDMSIEQLWKGNLAYASSHRLAENNKWMAWSSSSDWERKYESIIFPIAVVRSFSHSGTIFVNYHAEESQYCTRVHKQKSRKWCLPGNLTNWVLIPIDSRREWRRAICVVLPERSRPSITTNGARFCMPVGEGLCQACELA